MGLFYLSLANNFKTAKYVVRVICYCDIMQVLIALMILCCSWEALFRCESLCMKNGGNFDGDECYRYDQ